MRLKDASDKKNYCGIFSQISKGGHRSERRKNSVRERLSYRTGPVKILSRTGPVKDVNPTGPVKDVNRTGPDL